MVVAQENISTRMKGYAMLKCEQKGLPDIR
jgi:hypothetical protein